MAKAMPVSDSSGCRFRTAYGPKARVRFVPVGESRTKASFAAECDINTIMKRYEATGILPGMERAAGARYVDCTGPDYQEALMIVCSAKSMFHDLPVRVRDRFENDPGKLLEFCDDPRNYEEARSLGLLRSDAPKGTPLAMPAVEPVQGDPGKALSRIEAGEGAQPVAATPKA